MKKLFIAEKPDIGRCLAQYLWPNGNAQKTKHYIQNGDTTVTWAFGHILRQAEPAEYDAQFKTWSNYPIFPDTWILKPTKATKEQLDAIKELLAKTDVVIHAGDPDREGQLLVDEILYYFKFKGTVQRILINAKDDASMKRAFENICNNEKYRPLYEAGLGRVRADWLVGMNLSRAYTVNARKYGYSNSFNIGRVKVPTLALVVNREKAIASFAPSKYYTLTGHFVKDDVSFQAALQATDKLPLDEDNRVVSKESLLAVLEDIKQEPVSVASVEVKNGKEQPPLPYSLDTLQVEANKKHGYSPKEVLDTVQSLYEKKFVSYPRSDCNYIPISQKGDSKKILGTLAAFGMMTAGKADPVIVSKCWNDNKITAHHAIIPTGELPKELTAIETTIFKMIAIRYILQFYPPFEFRKVKFTLQAGNEIFAGSGRETLVYGYKQVISDDKNADTDENSRLPKLSVGDTIPQAEYFVNDKITEPPKRFTEGTLLAAMSNIWRFMDPKNPNREKLKEVKGIGTSATRDEIIAELQETTHKGKPCEPCLKKEKNVLLPTAFGITLINLIDQSLTVPDTTAEMECSLSEIAMGHKKLAEYMSDVTAMVKQNIHHAETTRFPLPDGRQVCPICQEGVLMKRHSHKNNSDFYVCSNSQCVHPVTQKTMYYSVSSDGTPIIAFCPDDQTLLTRIKRKDGGFFWSCPKCRRTFNDKSGQPDLTPKKKKK